MSTPHHSASARPDLSSAEWEKSSYSDNAGNGDCVEFSKTFATSHGLIPVGDTKTPGVHLVFPVDSWAAFTRAAANGEFGSA